MIMNNGCRGFYVLVVRIENTPNSERPWIEHKVISSGGSAATATDASHDVSFSRRFYPKRLTISAFKHEYKLRLSRTAPLWLAFSQIRAEEHFDRPLLSTPQMRLLNVPVL